MHMNPISESFTPLSKWKRSISKNFRILWEDSMVRLEFDGADELVADMKKLVAD